jgi:hypothetical protein
VPVTVRTRSGPLDVALHDASAELGIAVEIHQRGDFLTALLDQATSAAHEWDVLRSFPEP